MNDHEIILDIQKKVKRIQILHGIMVTIAILGFLGILSAADALKKLKH